MRLFIAILFGDDIIKKIQNEMNPGAFSDFYYGYVKLRTGEICKRGLETRSYAYFISKIYD